MDTTRNTSEPRLSRRASLLKAGGLVAAAVGGGIWKATDDAEAAGDGTGPAAVAAGLVTCVLTPEMTEGPYYLDGDKVRRDITEGKPGTALTLRLKVVDASSCRPIKGASVDIWHCDASGTYSGFAQEGTSGKTYLRGVQRTDANGVAAFKTIYPGWYRGRTVHIHVQVHVGGNVVHTGQLFFPEAVSATVYKRAPYATRGTQDTHNTDDSIYRNGGPKSMLRLVRSGTGFVGTSTMGVQRS
jgi:protocatechuate 3,4-dioxygenase beta subunit